MSTPAISSAWASIFDEGIADFQTDPFNALAYADDVNSRSDSEPATSRL